MNETCITPPRDDESRVHWWHMPLITSLCLVIYLAGNGQISLWDRDEAWYAQTAREMLQSGDYVVPKFNGQPRLRKPVLIYWLMAGAYSLFGDNEFGARFFCGLAGTATCLLTYQLGSRMLGRMVGLAAALMLAVAPFMVIESKLATTDAVLTAILTGAMLCLWEIDVGGSSWRWSLMFWFLIAVAILTKGPFGPIFIATSVFTWLLLSKKWSLLRNTHWIAGPVLTLLICLPWGIAIFVATGGEFYRVAFGEQAMGHSFSAMNGHRGFPGFYLALVLGGFMPWTMALGLAFSGIRRWAREAGPGSFLLGWIIGPLVMVECMRTKLPQYYLAAFPAWSILIARGLVQLQAVDFVFKTRQGRRQVALLGTVGVLAALALGSASLLTFPRALQPPSIAIATILGTGTLLAISLFRQLRDPAGWAAVIGTWWGMALVLFAWLLPNAEPFRVARRSAGILRDNFESGEPLVLFGFREPSLVFYLGRPVPSFGSPKELLRFLKPGEPALTLLRDSDSSKLRRHGIKVEPCQRIDARPIAGFQPEAVTMSRITMPSASTQLSAIGP